MRAFGDESLLDLLRSSPLHVIAAGKAASGMASAWLGISGLTTASLMVVTTHQVASAASSVETCIAGHPLADDRSVAAAGRALAVARDVSPENTLVLLLSGGASALLSRPLDGIALVEKQQVVNAMLRGSADIHALNTVRKHLSAIKGGRLAEMCAGRTITLAISDVVGDDLSVIGSGPGVPDPSTWSDAWYALNRHVDAGQQPVSVREVIEAGVTGRLPDTPKPGGGLSARVDARVVAGRFDVMRGARDEAARLGYDVLVLEAPVVGEARAVAPDWLASAIDAAGARERVCVITSGETTVRVRGKGVGGRNQEFALALAPDLALLDRRVTAASVGTDGIDGPTDAAGAVVDDMTLRRAAELGLDVASHLNDNNTHPFFAALDDLIVTGPTGTNVGDLQVALL